MSSYALWANPTYEANVEVTGAARLYRAASVWTAGLAISLFGFAFRNYASSYSLGFVL